MVNVGSYKRRPIPLRPEREHRPLVRTIAHQQLFAVFSDVHGNLPALEAILADIERRGVADVLCLGDLVGYGPFPNEVAALVRERGIPTPHGQLRPGHRLLDRRLRLRLQDRRAARRGRRLAGLDRRGDDRGDARLPAHARGPLRPRDAGRRAARGARQPAAHQRVPLRGPARARHGAHGRGEPVPRHPLRAHARALRARGRARRGRRDDAVRQRRQRRPAQGRRLARLLRARRPGRLAAGGPAVEFVRVPYDYERLQGALAPDRPDHHVRAPPAAAGAGPD